MTTINTNTSATTAFVVTPDTTGTFVVNTGSGVGAERMRIDSSGNVGIGANSPTVKLNVVGGATSGVVDDAALFSGGVAGVLGSGAAIYLSGANSVSRGVEIAGINTNGAGNAHAMTFSTSASTAAPTEQMRLTSSGDLQFNSGYGSVATAYGCRAWVNFNGTAAGTFAGGASTVSRTAGSTTATVTTTTAHGLITGNQVYALTGVVAGAYVVTFISATQFSFTTVATTVLTAASITFAVNSIRDSGNVSSVADNATGDYTVNFATAMPDANYTWTHAVGFGTTSPNDALTCTLYGTVGTNQTASAVRIITSDANSPGLFDANYVGIAIFR